MYIVRLGESIDVLGVALVVVLIVGLDVLAVVGDVVRGCQSVEPEKSSSRDTVEP